MDAIGCVGICEETWMGFPEERRIDMQKDVARILFGWADRDRSEA